MTDISFIQKTSTEQGRLPLELGVVLLWAALGLTITALMFTLGADVAQALAVMG